MKSKRLEEAAAFIAAAESGDAEQYLYEKAALLIEAEMRARPSLTQRDVGVEIGKGQSYVKRLLLALSRARDSGKPFRVDWQSGSNQRKKVIERAEPEVLIEVLHQKIEQAPPEERKELTQAVTNESTVAGRHIANEVIEREHSEKRKQAERKIEEPLTGIPLPALWASMCMTIDRWARELSTLRDEDLAELVRENPDGAQRVLAVVERLDEQVERYRNGLRVQPDLKVIENDGVIDMVVAV